MPTFYDPIELEEIDFNDPIAKFYLIQLPNDAGFKLCATTQNLDSPQMSGGDPVTRVQRYWPITLEQLNASNLAVLFPDNSLRAAPMTLVELNEAFHFISPFNPDTTPSYEFGPPHSNDPEGVPPSLIPAGQSLEFLNAFAQNIGLPLDFLYDLYQNNHNGYERLIALCSYVKNHNENINPHAALSVEEALDLSPQEEANLYSAYDYLLRHDLPIDEVRLFTENERLIIEYNGQDEDVRQEQLTSLRQYQEQMNHGHGISP